MIYNKIMKYCNENSLSVSAFEKKCGIANGTVGKWKDGGNPSLETLHKIVSATGVPISEWIKENDVWVWTKCVDGIRKMIKQMEDKWRNIKWYSWWF